jgi:hypothetical protein
MLLACATATGTGTPSGGEAPDKPSAEPDQTEEEPEAAPTPPPPQRVEFPLEDGMTIVGMFYPPTFPLTPGVLLLHQMGTDKEVWEPLPQVLRGEAPTPDGRSLPVEQGYAVLTIDIPGHGETGGTYENAAALAAVRAALAFFRTLDGIDPDRIVIMGASIGADAAVDECGEGCVGAISLSPGSWLDIPYGAALAQLLELSDPPVLCVASANDRPSPETCEEGQPVGLSDYQVHIYDGSAHGNYLLTTPDLMPAPEPYDLILDWLLEHVPTG